VDRGHDRVLRLVPDPRRRETAIGQGHRPHLVKFERLPPGHLPRPAEARYLVAPKQLAAVLADAVHVRLDIARSPVVVEPDDLPLRDGLADKDVHPSNIQTDPPPVHTRE